MARRRPVASADVGEVLPRHLVEPKRMGAGEYRAVSQERNAWLRAHGINPGDWSEVRAAVRAAQTAYGIPDTVERHRRRLQVRDQGGDRQ